MDVPDHLFITSLRSKSIRKRDRLGYTKRRLKEYYQSGFILVDSACTEEDLLLKEDERKLHKLS